MDTMAAFARGMAAQGQPHKVFDWEKAARLIAERKPAEAEAGLSEDWGYTGGTIYRDGKPLKKDETYVYLSSNWATPVLRLDEDEIDYWRYEKDTPGWSGDTFWPDSALALIGESK